MTDDTTPVTEQMREYWVRQLHDAERVRSDSMIYLSMCDPEERAHYRECAHNALLKITECKAAIEKIDARLAGAGDAPEAKPAPARPPSPAEQIVADMAQAIHATVSDRGANYGAAEDNFENIAILWTAWLKARYRAAFTLDALDAGVMAAELKHARLIQSPGHEDSALDAAIYPLLGYAARRVRTSTREGN